MNFYSRVRVEIHVAKAEAKVKEQVIDNGGGNLK